MQHLYYNKSVGTVATICQRGIAKHPDVDNKDNSPRPSIYVDIYNEHERFVAYYSHIIFEIGDFL
jgi:hypothetical protein